jgi:hypothetical protein
VGDELCVLAVPSPRATQDQSQGYRERAADEIELAGSGRVLMNGSGRLTMPTVPGWSRKIAIWLLAIWGIGLVVREFRRLDARDNAALLREEQERERTRVWPHGPLRSSQHTAH